MFELIPAAVLAFIGGVLGFTIGIAVGYALKKTPPVIRTPFIACPYCAEPIRVEAKVCRTCHKNVSQAVAELVGE
jgi:hypothetical protein